MIRPEHLTLIDDPCYYWTDGYGNKEPRVMEWMINEPNDVYWTPNLIIHQKEYSGESIVDMERDISEMFDGRFNPLSDKIPVDQDNIHKGKFKIIVTWSAE